MSFTVPFRDHTDIRLTVLMKVNYCINHGNLINIISPFTITCLGVHMNMNIHMLHKGAYSKLNLLSWSNSFYLHARLLFLEPHFFSLSNMQSFTHFNFSSSFTESLVKFYVFPLHWHSNVCLNVQSQ